MARLTVQAFEKIEKQRNTVHSCSRAGYSVFVEGGQTYFQIDTYGSVNRKTEEKLSQSIQIDRDMAAVLVKLLCETYPDLCV